MLRVVAQRLLVLPRWAKLLVVLLLDVTVALLSMWLAFYLRLEVWDVPRGQELFLYVGALLFLPFFVYWGLYRAVFRYVGMQALEAMGKAVLAYALLFFILIMWVQPEGVPRSVGLIQPLVFTVLAGLWRVVARYWLGRCSRERMAGPKGRLLIYGAGEAGVQTALALSVMREYSVVAFVDADAQKVGRSIHGLRIIAPSDVPEWVARYKVSDILLAIPSLGWQQRRRVIDSLRSLPVRVRSLPGMLDLAQGKVSISDFKELEIEDLLGRAPVDPDADLLAQNLRGKVVLVTGAGGSIGSELCRQIVQEGPRRLVLLEHNEFGLYAIHQELLRLCQQQGYQLELRPVLGTIRSLRRLRVVFAAEQPDVVFHAAAYKHVPLVQSNPSEGVLNNVLGTLNVARAAMEVGVGNFVLISTDKAVRPPNVMGASKRMAELCLQALAASDAVSFAGLTDECGAEPVPRKTNFSMVRFGNVLGSSGSVVPLFRQQLKRGGPLTVTHEEVTRYFMTIPEAAQLVLQAGAMAQGGEVFVLDMGEPVKIVDLARKMVELSGLKLRDAEHPDGDIEVKVVGLRPGEKLYEELLIGDNPMPTQHERIMMARERFLPWHELLPAISALEQAARLEDTATVRAILAKHVAGFDEACEASEA